MVDRSKRPPGEALIDLRRRLALLSPRDPARTEVMARAAEVYGVSVWTIYRALRKLTRPKSVRRSDHHSTRGNKRMRRLILIAFALAGCAARGEPVVTNYDGFVVTITQPRAVPQHEADAVAAKTCGRPATQLSKLCTDLPCTQEKLIYWCR